MASISTSKTGARRLLFFNADGERKSLHLGKVPKKQATTIQSHVEAIVAAHAAKMSPPIETSTWLGGISDRLHAKLAKQGLAASREVRAANSKNELKLFLDALFESRSDIKKSTKTAYNHTRRCLVSFFTPQKRIADITVADANKWKRWLTDNQKLSESTIRRRCGVARQFFNEAVDDRLISVNPFGKMKGIGVQSNRERDYFVTRSEAARVLDACPNAEWRLIFALSRFGGLRCPSEHLKLCWGDIDLAGGRMTVHSPKTEHHRGKDKRVVPIFSELREYLEDAQELAGDLANNPAEPVISRYREGANLRTQLERIIRRAGLKPWPKLFQNLRASRQTELAKDHPIHVACAWIGNSPRVAGNHYLQVTDADFEVALKPTKKVTQKTTQSAAGRGKLEWTGKDTNPQKSPENAKTPTKSGSASGRAKTRTWDLSLIRAAL
jgi:integrase